ncbi:MAG: hypothetical protein C5B50_20575 [Verrucomicrobia bacterium]|nr:MAG: hypothetical protein C5B50_20575 [Verrucomicrobiota bacterium]
MENGRVDCAGLVDDLVRLHANSYNFLIHQAATDWDDLHVFLPLARQHGLRVWVSLVPPSESAPRTKLYCEPFRLDYVRWASELAKLSTTESNLVAWSIDDFPYNLGLFTTNYVREMLDASRAANSRFAFLPCCYYKQLTPPFVKNYGPLFDGVLFPYRDESGGANLKEAGHVGAEIKTLRERLGNGYPIILDVYSTAHSRLGASTPEYVEQVIRAALESADGVCIYTHPKKDNPKYEVVRKLFGQSK